MATSELVGKTYCIRTYGCQMNLHDSERVSGLLDSCGCIAVADPVDADIVVFMTCCVRENADNKLYGHVSELVSAPLPPSGLRTVALGGCIAQRDGDVARRTMPNVGVVFGTQALSKLPELICASREDGKLHVDVSEPYAGFSTDLPSRRERSAQAWVPIMYGCDNFCSYCIVPYVRGRERSRDMEDVVIECDHLVRDGVREITLLGQNVNSYGRDRYGEPRFHELLRRVGETGIERIRFTSSNPKDLSEPTMRAMAEVDAVMPHLHLAVQSGSTRILKAMRRSYTREEYIDLVSRLRSIVGDIALSTDVIVGFPGETEEDFLETMSLFDEVRFSSAFTFIYSRREGTAAASLVDHTPSEVIHERFDRLAKRVEELAFEANQPMMGERAVVLVEGASKKDPRVMVGHSERNQTVHFRAPEGIDPESLIGSMCDVRVETARTWYLAGELEGTPH